MTIHDKGREFEVVCISNTGDKLTPIAGHIENKQNGR